MKKNTGLINFRTKVMMLSQREFGSYLKGRNGKGVTTLTVHNWETGKSKMSLSSIRDVVELAKTNGHELSYDDLNISDD